MRKSIVLAIVAAASLLSAGRASADVRLTMHDGLVSIVARDATLRQILEEWARVGQTRIVNLERIPGTPMTIELADVPEKQALDILLRSVSGYLAAPRSTFVPNASRFDRILVNPAAAQPRTITAGSSAPSPPLPQSRFQLQPVQPEDDASNPNLPGEPGRQPIVNVYTPPMPMPSPEGGGRGPNAPGPAGANMPGAVATPVGTSAPGMVLQPQPQPQPQSQPLQPQPQPRPF